MVTIKHKRPNSSRLSEREQRLVQLISEDKHTLTRCLIMAGYSRSTALTKGARIRRKPRVQKAIILERIKRGLFCSDQELALIGREGLDSR